MADVPGPPQKPAQAARRTPRRRLPTGEPTVGTRLAPGSVTVTHTAGPYDWIECEGWFYILDLRTGCRLRGAETSERATKKIVEQLNDLERPWATAPSNR